MPQGPLLPRRTLLLGLASACSVPWSSPKEDAPAVAPSSGVVRPADVPRWLAEARAGGLGGPDVLRSALQMALDRCVETMDLHPLLIFGPAWRLAPEDDRLLLWTLLQVADWWEFAGCTSPPVPSRVGPSVDGLFPRTSDAHPAILVSEARFLEPHLPTTMAQDLLGRSDRLSRALEGRADVLSRVRTTGTALAAAQAGPVTAEDVAQWVVSHGAGVLDTLRAAPPSYDVLWQGLWLAAASAWLGYGGPLNPTHTITCLAATQRFATSASGAAPWLAAAAIAARLALDMGPVPPFAVVREGWHTPDPQPRTAWRTRAMRPGVDVHDLKFCEAVAQAPESVFATVSGLAARSGRLVASPWPTLDEAWAQYTPATR